VVGYIVVVLAIYLGIAGLLFVFQRNLLYFPDGHRPSPVAVGVSEMEEVGFTTDDGLELFSWYAPAPEGRPTLVFFHGNAGNLASRAFKAKAFMRAGVGVMLVEYRGYGGNPGKPTEQGLYMDARAALKFLERRGVSPQDIILYGESLGSGVAVQMASEVKVAGLVLETPYTSMPDVAGHHYFWLPVQWLVRDRYESKNKIASISTPLLVLHGSEDKTVPPKFGKALYNLAVEPKTLEIFEGGAHNDLYDFRAADTVLRFIE